MCPELDDDLVQTMFAELIKKLKAANAASATEAIYDGIDFEILLKIAKPMTPWLTRMTDIAVDVRNLAYPRFIDGARRAPPEDIGGIPGFEEFVEAMTKSRHPERKRLIEWYGRVFDPEDIELQAVQANIAKLARRRAIGKAAFAKSRRSES